MKLNKSLKAETRRLTVSIPLKNRERTKWILKLSPISMISNFSKRSYLKTMRKRKNCWWTNFMSFLSLCQKTIILWTQDPMQWEVLSRNASKFIMNKWSFSNHRRTHSKIYPLRLTRYWSMIVKSCRRKTLLRKRSWSWLRTTINSKRNRVNSLRKSLKRGSRWLSWCKIALRRSLIACTQRMILRNLRES